MSEHTPTPWCVTDTPTGLRIYHEELDGKLVCEFPYDWLEDRKNAAFIVMACNAHEKLVSLLRRCERAIPNAARNESLLVELHAALKIGAV